MEKNILSNTDSTENDIELPLEVESLCMNCYKNGYTKILTTIIPYYKQVIIMSFFCEHCGFKNNELQSGEKFQEHGTEIVLKVINKIDLNRTVVKSEYSSIEIPELELQIPSNKHGEITNVEGILNKVYTNLQETQTERYQNDPIQAKKIDEFIIEIKEFMELNKPWKLKLKDPSGNCFIENPNPLNVDPQCIISHYHRSLDENKFLGLIDDNEVEDVNDNENDNENVNDDPKLLINSEWKCYDDCKKEILRFKGICDACSCPIETLMKATDIPYFQTVIIMSTCCENCGYKYNDVKSGGKMQDFGCKLTLTLSEEVDLSRDVIKSDTCYLYLPYLNIEIGSNSLSGKFTTIEGLLNGLKDLLIETSKFFFGDAGNKEKKEKFEQIFKEIDDIKELKKKDIQIILDDPAGNSYIQSLIAPLDDKRLKKEFYKRNYEQNEDLGLNDIKVENYQTNTILEENENDN